MRTFQAPHRLDENTPITMTLGESRTICQHLANFDEFDNGDRSLNKPCALECPLKVFNIHFHATNKL